MGKAYKQVRYVNELNETNEPKICESSKLPIAKCYHIVKLLVRWQCLSIT